MAEKRAKYDLAEQRKLDIREKAEQRRAEIYAINSLMAAKQERDFLAFTAERAGELEEIEQRHACEIELEQKEKARAEKSSFCSASALQKRLRAATEEVKTIKQKEEAAEEARRAATKARQEDMRIKEEEREIHRAQVYAINKLMTARDAVAFDAFKKARATVDVG